MNNKFQIFKCGNCGSLIEIVEECKCNDCGIKCCGEMMTEEKINGDPNIDIKHLPIYERVEDEIVVNVGKEKHPMTKDHYIEWIAVVSENRINKVKLYPEQDIEIRFKYIPGSNIYAYCNKHGLWISEVK